MDPNFRTKLLEFVDVSGRTIVPTGAQAEVCAHMLATVDSLLAERMIQSDPEAGADALDTRVMVGYPLGVDAALATALTAATLLLRKQKLSIAIFTADSVGVTDTVAKLIEQHAGDCGVKVVTQLSKVRVLWPDVECPSCCWVLEPDDASTRGLSADVLFVNGLEAVTDAPFGNTIAPIMAHRRSASVALVAEHPGASSALWADELGLGYTRVADEGR